MTAKETLVHVKTGKEEKKTTNSLAEEKGKQKATHILPRSYEKQCDCF